MKYLVIGESIEIGTLPPQHAAEMIEHQVIPSLEAMARMEKENKIIAGGIYSGGRTGVAIIEAESNDEVDTILEGMPMWGIIEWRVVPLSDFAKRATDARGMVEKMKTRA